MKKELEVQRSRNQVPDLHFQAEELLSSEMFEIKGGLAASKDCTLCSSSCAVACTSGCAVCTGCTSTLSSLF